MLLSSASLQTDFCADLKDDQTRGTRRKPVPKQRCISAPHGTSSTLPCWRLCNRSGALAGKQTRLPTSPSPLRLLLQLHRVKTIVLAFFFFEPLYLSLVSSAAIRAFCCCTPPGKAKLRLQRGSLVLSYTTSLGATPDDLHLLVDRAGRWSSAHSYPAANNASSSPRGTTWQCHHRPRAHTGPLHKASPGTWENHSMHTNFLQPQRALQHLLHNTAVMPKKWHYLSSVSEGTEYLETLKW